MEIANLFRRIPKSARFPVMQTLTEKIVLTNESSTDKNFAFYVPRDDNRFKLVLVPGYGVLKPGDEMTVDCRFTLLMTSTIDRKVKFEVLGTSSSLPPPPPPSSLSPSLSKINACWQGAERKEFPLR
jgi:hypothetical protein